MSSTVSSRPYFDESGKTDAETYFEAVLDGSIVACKRIIKLAQRILPEIRNGYRIWRYDPDHALKPVRFIEKFCKLGEGKKAGQPFILEPYERAIIETAFGFVDEDGHRRFQEVLVQIGRKNGKTELCAALNIYMLMKAGERGAEIYNVATTTEQASLCMGKTEAMIKANDLLDSRIRKGKIAKRKVIGLNYDATNSYLCTLSAKGSTKDGLNPFFAVMDELGACRDHGEMYDQITEALGAREEPMVFIISTENRVRNNIWDERKKYATDWLDGTIEDDRLLAFMYELDDRSEIFDEECWIKANPGIDVVKSRQFIRDRLNKCSQSPERMPSLLTKDFNLVANQYTSYLTYEECSPDMTYVSNPDTDRYCVIGFDLAERNDLNAAVAIFRRPGEDIIYEKAMFWLAEEQLGLEDSNQKQRDGVPYLKWQSDGLIRIMQGSKINQRVIVDWINELYEEGLYPMAIAFDKWHVDDWTLRELEGMVGSKNLHPVQPWAKEISQAMKEHKIDLGSNSVNDNDNSILHWCRGNVQARRDDSNNVWPLKKELKPENRIDGYMAEIYAYIAYKKHEESYLSMIGEDPKRVMSVGSQEIDPTNVET